MLDVPCETTLDQPIVNSAWGEPRGIHADGNERRATQAVAELVDPLSGVALSQLPPESVVGLGHRPVERSRAEIEHTRSLRRNGTAVLHRCECQT